MRRSPHHRHIWMRVLESGSPKTTGQKGAYFAFGLRAEYALDEFDELGHLDPWR